MANTLPALYAVAITPSDSANLLRGDSVALYIGIAGTLRVMCGDGTECTFAAVSAGLLPIRIRRVYATGTSATSIVALY